jgi:hypothetical protein
VSVHGFNPVYPRLGYVSVETEHESLFYIRLCHYDELTQKLDQAAQACFSCTSNPGIHIRTWLPSVVAVKAYHPDAIARAIADCEESAE